MISTESNHIRKETVRLADMHSYMEFVWDNDELIKINFTLNDRTGNFTKVDLTSYNSKPTELYNLLEHYFEEKFKEMQKPNIQQV